MSSEPHGHDRTRNIATAASLVGLLIAGVFTTGRLVTRLEFVERLAEATAERQREAIMVRRENDAQHAAEMRRLRERLDDLEHRLDPRRHWETP